MKDETNVNLSHRKKHLLAFWRWKLHWQILLGLIIGSLLGFISGHTALISSQATGAEELAVHIITARWDYMLYDLLGDLFLNGLKLIIIPLITSSIVLAISGLAALGGFGRLGLKTISYYLTTSTIAVLIGLCLINLVKPGGTESGEPIFNKQVAEKFETERADIESKVGDSSGTDFLNVFRKMIPSNPAVAAVEGNFLGLIVIAILIGYFLSKLKGSPRTVMTDFWQGLYDITIAITELVLKFAPLGVGMLLAATVAENYARLAQEERFDEFLTAILSFTATTFGALLIHFIIVLPLILMLMARVNPIRHYVAMAPALMTAFSTASSSATLPVTMECIEKNAGVSNRTASFVLPLGATVNMDGTALYECVAAIFIAQAFGVELSFSQQFLVVLIALFTSIGVAGIPSASLVAILIILQSLSTQFAAKGIDVPLELGLPILFVFDSLLDMCRTAVNVFSDSCGAIVIAVTEGENNILNPAVEPE